MGLGKDSHHTLRSVIPVITGMPGARLVSLDNSVFARFCEDVQLLNGHPQSRQLRRILRLILEKDLREQLNLEFAISQALYYDRTRESPSDEAFIRLAASSLATGYLMEVPPFPLELPVAEVKAFIQRLPAPTEVDTIDDQGITFQRRWTPFKIGGESSEIFDESLTILVPICTYEQGEVEDIAASAFGFPSFDSAPSSRVADVCYVASHLRFCGSADPLLALDAHFDKRRLEAIGVTSMSPDEFLEEVDPGLRVAPIEMDVA